MQKATLRIEGMHCGACATGIQMLLSGTDGVASAAVDYDGKRGDIEYDPSKVSVEAMIKAIAELGYTAAPA